jgi:hypothetical protein
MKCHNCGKPASFQIKAEEGVLYLCIDCNLKYECAQTLEYQRHAHLLNQTSALFNSMSGIPGLAPQVPIPQIQPIPISDMIINNIHVDNSAIGVLNTGNIEKVDAAVTVLKETGEASAANAIVKLTEAVANKKDIDKEIKDNILEVLGAIATEATVPKDQRRRAVIRPLITQLATWFSGLAGLSHLWDKYGSIIEVLFK